jgi:hypothetical protein
VSWQKLFLLVAIAVAWLLMAVLLVGFFSFGDCFDEQCEARRLWVSRAFIAVGIASYLAIAWNVLRRPTLD